MPNLETSFKCVRLAHEKLQASKYHNTAKTQGGGGDGPDFLCTGHRRIGMPYLVLLRVHTIFINKPLCI